LGTSAHTIDLTNRVYGEFNWAIGLPWRALSHGKKHAKRNQKCANIFFHKVA
jgi:hypothetical protein